MKKKFLSLILSFSLAFGLMATPVYAAPEDEKSSEQTVEEKETEAVTEENDEVMEEATEEKASEEKTSEEKKTESKKAKTTENVATYSVDSDAIDVSEITPYSVSADEDFTVDEENPAVIALADELGETTVEDSEGKSVALTQDQIDSILDLYQKYLKQWEDNADLLGVQMPFFLNYNDNGEDGLGILGEMLVLAGHTVDEVRNGEYSYDDLTGMIMNFLYADYYGIEFYGDDIKAKRTEAIEAVKNSGATTDVQKLLVLNDWLAHQATFDMSYIMNMGKDEPVMAAPDGTDITDHEHYTEIHDGMYKVYEEQITKQFHDQIYASVVAQFRQQYYEGAIKNIIYEQALAEIVGSENTEEATDEQKEQATAVAEQYMTEHADEISEDAAGFVESTFGAEAAAQISAGADDFIKDAEENGVEVDPDNAPGYKMTIEEITQNTMENEKILDLDGDGTEDTTANDAIPIFAEQAATGLTEGIIGAWEGNHIGILAEGTGVCAGYSKAFAYLLQYMSPEQYGVNGAETDMSKAEKWKTAKDLYYTNDKLDTDQDYVVDMVRIKFKADVSMFGEESNFGETHFWNAVKVNGEWYYVDPCYTDIYVECMSRDRVEIDGTMNHMYFMFSDDTAREMYEGNMEEIAGLYQGVARDTSYEDSWFARISSNAYSDGKNFYYLYDSTDQLSMMREFGDMESSGGQGDFDEEDFKALMEGSDPDYKLVYHSIDKETAADVKGGADSDFTTLIEFNPKNEDDETTKALVRDKDGEMVENDLLTDLFAQYKEECEIYPSIKITTALYNGKLYFNLSNCILSYDLTEGTVEKVKEYNTVYGERNNSIAFGGMAFTITDSESNADLTVNNHPIAAMTIKEDNKMYVSVATNYAFVSGKSRDSEGKQNINDSKDNTYGYQFEESNYNSNYSSYTQGSDIDDSQLESMGYRKETNDNDEFMWSAVIVEKIDMSQSCSHSYEDVTVEPYCGRDGYTESRCTKCGAIEADSRKVDEDSALDHHYVHFDETYYTKNSDGNFNTGDCYVCTICGDSVSKPTEPGKQNAQESDEDYQKRKEEYEKEKEIYDKIVETAGHTYEPTDAEWSDDFTSVKFSKLECSSVCPEKKSRLDCLVEDGKIDVTLKDSVTAEAEVTGSEGECPTGVTVVYTATGEAEGYKYTAVKKVKQDSAKHEYTGTATDESWEAITDEDGNVTGYSKVTITDLKCKKCGSTVEESVEATDIELSDKSVAPKCEEEGKNVYVATATVTDEEGNEIGTVTVEKEDKLEPIGHDYRIVEDFNWADDYSSATAKIVCENDTTHFVETDCAVSYETDDATCDVAGKITYTATATFKDKDGKTISFKDKDGKITDTATDVKEVEGKSLGHDYDEPTYVWASDYSSATAKFVCKRKNGDKICNHEETVESTNISKNTDNAAATYVEDGVVIYIATFEFNGKTYNTPEEPVIVEKKLNAKAALKKTSVSIYAGESSVVELTSLYDKDEIVSATSSNSSYATVSKSGKKLTIVGKKAGSVTVTVTTASKEKASVKVTVKAATSESATATEIAKLGDKSDLKNSTYKDLKARVSTAKSTSLTVKWSKFSGASGYIIYGSKCGSKYKYKKLKTTTSTSYTQKSLKKGTYYKYIVVAYKNVAGGKKIIIARSKSINAVTTGGKYVNPSSVKPKVSSKSISKNKTYKLSVKTVLSKGKKMKTYRKVRFESSDPKVATVTSSGTIKGITKGKSCSIYVYAQNGAYKAVKVTVK